MELLKDAKEIRHISNVDKALNRIANILRNMPNEEPQRISYLRKVFLEGQISEKPSKPNHNECKKCNSSRTTEKRICRCMKYYGFDMNECMSCELEKKWKNIGSIYVVDYEVPMKHAYDKVGGIDLIIQTDEGKYAVEIKPPKGNKESIARMFAEILTYTIEPDTDDNYYHPAIGLFNLNNNFQMKQFIEKKDNPDLEYILKYITVFIINIVDKGDIIEYSIKQYK